MTQVLITGWQPGLNKVALTKLLRERAGLTLAQAHDKVNRCLDGESVVIELPTAAAARAFVGDAGRLGAVVDISAAGQPR